jgi:hypothetical protein
MLKMMLEKIWFLTQFFARNEVTKQSIEYLIYGLLRCARNDEKTGFLEVP